MLFGGGGGFVGLFFERGLVVFVWFLMSFTPDFLSYLQRSTALCRRLVTVPKTNTETV